MLTIAAVLLLLGACDDCESRSAYPCAANQANGSTFIDENINRVHRSVLALAGQLLLERGYNRGIELLREAAQLGHAGAQALLAMLSYDERWRIYNPEAAAAWAEKSAAQGDANGQFILGVILYDRTIAMKSEAITPIEERAMAWLQAAASQGHKQAHSLLGGIFEIRGAYAKARYHYRQAVYAGHSFANSSLADLLMEGLGGPVDEDEAIRLYCEAGDFDAETAEILYGIEIDC